MNTYTPDRWVIVEMNSAKHGKIRKVLASWYGGYGGSDSWKLSSGNLEMIDKGDFYEIPQESGSTYKCYKQAAGMSNYTSGILYSWQKQLAEVNDGTTMEIVEDYVTI